MTTKTPAERVAKHRASGRSIGVTLTDPKAIAKLEKLATKLGGVKAAIEYALIKVKL